MLTTRFFYIGGMAIKKTFFSAALIVVVFFGLFFVGNLDFSKAQSGTSVIGTINSDATWTKGNSPYTLTGPVAVNTGVTLTIEPGATVNLNRYYIQVNGALVARGSNEDRIQFNGEILVEIRFTSSSNGWNEQIGSGSIIENATININRIIIYDESPKINNNILHSCGITVNEGSSIISNNIISDVQTSGVQVGGSAVIFNNTINECGIGINTIFSTKGDFSPLISHNVINGGSYGIYSSDAYISDNIISGCKSVGIYASGGLSTIEKNLITNNYDGIKIDWPTQRIIRNNTIANNRIGINTPKAGTSFYYNKIQDNQEYNMYLRTDNINATYN
jgi:hypothetical protein